MIIANLLAAGSGQRVGGKTPKQYIEINNIPIFIYTIKKFLINDIDLIVFTINKNYEQFVNASLTKHLKAKDKEKVKICFGGKTRLSSITESIKYINKITKEAFIITHDIARMHISKELIEEHVSYSSSNFAIGTFIPAIDTVYQKSSNNKLINLDRSKLINAQTPQSFKLSLFNDTFKNYDNSWEEFNDLCSIFNNHNIKIIEVTGSNHNFKITNKMDIQLSKLIING